MARPRKYRHINGDRCRLADHDNSYQPDSMFEKGLKLFPQTTRERWRGQAGWARRARNRFYHLPTPNGRKDPLSIMLVFDCLMRLETSGVVQGNSLTRILMDNYDQVLWDPITVGRILSSIAVNTEDCGDERDGAPLEREKTNGVTYYVISDNVKTREWMGRAREWLGEVVGQYIRDVRSGVENPLPSTIYAGLGAVE